MKNALTTVKALAEASRLRALLCLEQGALCAGQLSEALELAPSTISKHMGILVKAGLVDTWAEGRWRYYRLAPEQITPLARRMLSAVGEALVDCPSCTADLARTQAIRMRADAPSPGRMDKVLRSHASTGDSQGRATFLRRPAETSPAVYGMGYQSNQLRQG